MQGGFHEVGVLANLTVTAVADGGRFIGPAVLVFENAAKSGSGIDLRVRGEGLIFEFFQKAFAFVVEGAIAGIGAAPVRRAAVRH